MLGKRLEKVVALVWITDFSDFMKKIIFKFIQEIKNSQYKDLQIFFENY